METIFKISSIIVGIICSIIITSADLKAGNKYMLKAAYCKPVAVQYCGVTAAGTKIEGEWTEVTSPSN